VGDLLFIGSCAGNFYALNKTTGELKWSYDIRQDGRQVSFHGNPLVINDLILIGTDKSCDPEGIGHVYAFERESGKVRWKYRSTSVPTDIVQLNSNVYFGSFQDNWSSIDLHTGSLKWSFSTGASNKDCHLPRAPVIYKDRLVISGLDGVIYSLDALSGRVSWKRKLADWRGYLAAISRSKTSGTAGIRRRFAFHVVGERFGTSGLPCFCRFEVNHGALEAKVIA